MSTIKSGSAFIYYELFGNPDKEALVLLHGNGESSQHFKKHIDLLKDKFYILAIDSRGHGQSGFGVNSLSLSMMVIDLENVLNSLNMTCVNILGFSDGANVAMLFAVKNPKTVKRLVLVSGNLSFNGLTAKTRFWIAFGYYFSKIAGKIDPKNKIFNEFYLIMYKEPNILPQSLAAITAPVLVVAGTEDMVKTEHSRLIAESIKNSRLLLIEGADHFYIYKECENFCRTAENFFQNT